MSTVINWFEIPTTDFERALTFYSEILGKEIKKDDYMGVPHGFLATDDNQVVGGAIIGGQNTTPAANGVLIYLNAGDRLVQILERVEPAGGKIVLPRTSLGEQGHMAVIFDTEGNRIGLHSPN